MRIFLDANVLFSAAKSDGAVRQLLGLLRARRHELWVDGYVVEEARRNIVAKEPASLTTLDALTKRLRIGYAHAPDAALYRKLPLPEKDKPVLAAVIHHHCALLITGDRSHFGPLYGKTIHGVVVHSPRSAAESLLVGK
ncbi:MAG TPA: PIN domain-containing protein [Polyangiaceae bacterium]|jgi:predicted nucleic acid-binding protein